MDNAIITEAQVVACGQSVRRKRTHKKSRNGCLLCKRRRVKCDENIPCCKSCSERGFTCTYPKTVEPTIESSLCLLQPTSSPTAASSNEIHYSALPTRQSRRVPDALLWQYYLSYAGGTLAAAGTDAAYADMWQSSIPAVAHGDTGASHGLMALSALCMSAHQAHVVGGAFDYVATAALHYSRAMESLRNSILALERVNTDALLACSVMLIPCGMYLSRNTYSPTSEWLHHLRGFRTLGDVLNSSDSPGRSQHDLIPFPQDGTPERQKHRISPGQGISSHRAIVLLNSVRYSGHGAINKLWMTVAESAAMLSRRDIETYNAGIIEVHSVMDYILECHASSYLRAIFSWATEIPNHFVQMLASRDELANAIAAHWLVCVLLLDDLWFVDGFGAFRIEVVTGMLERARSPYLHLLNWPRKMLQEWKLG